MTATIIRPGDVLQYAVTRGDLARVRELLANGAPATAKGAHDVTPLHWAASGDEAEIASALVRHGADPDARAVDGCTPLHFAAREDAARAVAVLIASGADPAATNAAGRTAVDEIYDADDDAEGAAIKRMLEEAAAANRPRANPATTASPRGTTESSSSSSRTGGGSKPDPRSAEDAALERAMADLAALLAGRGESGGDDAGRVVADEDETSAAATRAERPAAAPRGIPTGEASETETRSASVVSASSGTATATDSNGGRDGGGFRERVVVARPYVAVASHDEPTPPPRAAAATRVRLGADGTLSEEAYRSIREAYFAAGLPREDPARGYERVPEVARTKMAARKETGRERVEGGCGPED